MSRQNSETNNDIAKLKEEERNAYYYATDTNSNTYKKYNKKAIRHKKKVKRKNKKKRALKVVLCVLLSFILLIVGTFFIMNYLGRQKLLNYKHVKIEAVKDAEINYDDNSIEYKGKNYVLNDNIISILCMGIDKNITEHDTFGGNGQSDAIFVLTIDVSNGKVNIIPINRDTMVDVNVYSEGGQFIGVEKQQICLSFSYGDGQKKSCKNVAESVSRLLYGVPVKSYFAMNLDAVETLNTLCGGVKVVPNETISYNGTYLAKGKPTILTNAQARTFVRYRNQAKDNSNVKRMQRQKMFLTSVIDGFSKQIKQDISSVTSIYKGVSKYSLTNIDLSQATFLATKVMSVNKNLNVEYKSIKGSIKKGKYIEFTPNEEELFELVLDVYYKEK